MAAMLNQTKIKNSKKRNDDLQSYIKNKLRKRNIYGKYIKKREKNIKKEKIENHTQ